MKVLKRLLFNIFEISTAGIIVISLASMVNLSEKELRMFAVSSLACFGSYMIFVWLTGKSFGNKARYIAVELAKHFLFQTFIISIGMQFFFMLEAIGELYPHGLGLDLFGMFLAFGSFSYVLRFVLTKEPFINMYKWVPWEVNMNKEEKKDKDNRERK